MYLGIDVGTSGVKAVLADAAGAVRATRTVALDLATPRPGWCEQDPADWWTAVREAVRGLDARDVRAIGLSGQMHGAVCLDAGLAVLRPAILWNDTRSFAQADRLAGVAGVEETIGVRPMPGFTATKIMWMAAHEPELHGRIAHVVTPKDWVRWKMTSALAMEMSDAAGTCWLDQASRQWSSAMAKASDTDPSWLPPLLEGTAIAGRLSGEAAAELGLEAGIPVAAGGGDAAQGGIGIGAVNPGDAFLSLGTSGQLFTVTDGYVASPGTLVHAFAHALPDTWFHMACLMNGASPLAWWADVCGTEVGALLEAAEGADAGPVLFLPYLVGERTPLNDPHIRGGFYGMGPGTRREAMTVAVLEGIAFSIAEAAKALEKAGTAPARMGAIGGGARSDRLLQLVADATGIALDRYEGAETGAALGAARTAMIADGMAVAEVATTPEIAARFEPRAEQAERLAPRHARWRRLYDALAPGAEAL